MKGTMHKISTGKFFVSAGAAALVIFGLGLFASSPALASVCPSQNGDGSIQCAGTNVYCGGTCVASDPVCSSPRTQINCGSCGCDCPSGQAYCGTFNTCVVPISCTGGQT